VNKILQKEYMKELFEVEVSPLERSVQLAYSFNTGQLKYLKTHVLGKTILYTDNHDCPMKKSLPPIVLNTILSRLSSK
jgi:hypothetical protein